MMLKIKMRNILLSTFLIFATSLLFAQNESYIYLEGIKGIFYKVKLNGVEQTAQSKRYYILTTAQEGHNNLEIEFIGDLYPPQNFIIDVLHANNYGYRLAKTNDEKFYLLDVINDGKIIESNSNINIRLSTADNRINFYQEEIKKSRIRKDYEYLYRKFRNN